MESQLDKETAIKKIQKCLALAKSNEPHEAASALRQAQKLMEQFGIEHPEILAAGVSSEWSKSSSSKRPTKYEVCLAMMVCDVFGCDLGFSRKLATSGQKIDGGYDFIGINPAPQIAAYTFCVLRRQIKKARADYIRTALKRHRKNKTAAADTFCEGWVYAARTQVSVAHRTPEQDQAMKAFVSINYDQKNALEPRARTTKTKVDNHLVMGWVEGKKSSVQRGISSNANTQLALL